MKPLIMHISIIPNFVAGFLGKLAKALKYIIYTHGLYETLCHQFLCIFLLVFSQLTYANWGLSNEQFIKFK